MWSSALAAGRSPPDKHSVAYLIRMFRLSFRSEALDELSSPEQLDEAIQVTSPMSWLAGTILLFIVLATLLWSLFGTLRTRIQGDGMITYQDARHIDIVSRHEGYVAELLVRDGDQVARGDVVARLENDAIVQRHEHAVRTLREIQREIETLERERDADLDELARVAEESRPALAESDLAQLDVTRNDRISAWRKMLLQAKQRLARQQVETTKLAAEMETALTVRAFADGNIVEVLAGVGTFLPPNAPIYRMTNQVSGLYAITFFSGDAAELIEPGMQAQVSLSTTSEEESGSLRGVVRDVSRFRLSSDALMALLGNRQLVEQFSRLGAPLAVEVDLFRGPDGRYEGITRQSTPFELEPGMLARVNISIREQRPITILIPALRWIPDTA